MADPKGTLEGLTDEELAARTWARLADEQEERDEQRLMVEQRTAGARVPRRIPASARYLMDPELAAMRHVWIGGFLAALQSDREKLQEAMDLTEERWLLMSLKDFADPENIADWPHFDMLKDWLARNG